jgi:hypothetical protein
MAARWSYRRHAVVRSDPERGDLPGPGQGGPRRSAEWPRPTDLRHRRQPLRGFLRRRLPALAARVGGRSAVDGAGLAGRVSDRCCSAPHRPRPARLSGHAARGAGGLARRAGGGAAPLALFARRRCDLDGDPGYRRARRSQPGSVGAVAADPGGAAADHRGSAGAVRTRRQRQPAGAPPRGCSRYSRRRSDLGGAAAAVEDHPRGDRRSGGDRAAQLLAGRCGGDRRCRRPGGSTPAFGSIAVSGRPSSPTPLRTR